MANLGDALIAKCLHNFIIAIFISLGFVLWNRKQSLFSWSWRRFFSYFFLFWSLNQILSGYFLSGLGFQEKMGIWDYLGALLHPQVFNLETFVKWYQRSPISGFYEGSSHFKIFQMIEVIYFSLDMPIIVSASLSLGFALWNPHLSFKKFSAKTLVSLFFLITAVNQLVFQTGLFLYKSNYLSLESYHSNASKSNRQRSD